MRRRLAKTASTRERGRRGRRGGERSREVKEEDEDPPEAGYGGGGDSEGGRERQGAERGASLGMPFEFLAKWPSVRSAGRPAGRSAIRTSRSQTKSHGFTYYDLHPCPLPSSTLSPLISSRLLPSPLLRRPYARATAISPSSFAFCSIPLAPLLSLNVSFEYLSV